MTRLKLYAFGWSLNTRTSLSKWNGEMIQRESRGFCVSMVIISAAFISVQDVVFNLQTKLEFIDSNVLSPVIVMNWGVNQVLSDVNTCGGSHYFEISKS